MSVSQEAHAGLGSRERGRGGLLPAPASLRRGPVSHLVYLLQEQMLWADKREDSPCGAFRTFPLLSLHAPSRCSPKPSFLDLPHHPRAGPGLLTLSQLPRDVGTLLLRPLGPLAARAPDSSSLPFCFCPGVSGSAGWGRGDSVDFLLAEWRCLDEHSFPQGPVVPQKLRSRSCPKG